MRRYIKTVVLVIIFGLLAGYSAVLASEALKDYYDWDGDAYVSNGNNNHSINFTASGNYTVTRYQAMLYRVGSIGDVYHYQLTLRERTGDNWSDGGTILCSQTFGYNDLPQAYTWVEAIPNGDTYGAVNLTQGTDYGIFLNFTAGNSTANRIIRWWGEGSNDKGFQAYTDLGKTGTWTPLSEDWDLYFRIYGDSNPVYYENGVWNTSSWNSTISYWQYTDDNCRRYLYIGSEWIDQGIDVDCVTEETGRLVIKETIQESINDLMALWGLDNTAGRYLVLFMMALLVMIFGGHKAVKAVGVSLVVAVGIALQWVDAWILLLCSIVIGLIIARFK